MTDNIKIVDVVLHYVGNTSTNEGVILSADSLKLNEDAMPYLKYYFLSAFKLEALCNFFHEARLSNNPMFSFAEEIFEKKRSFCDVSSDIACHLYEHSDHPKIKGGDLFVVLFKNVEVDHQYVDALGVFKIENKENYIRVSREGCNVSVDTENGVSIKKMDKGCLIFNIEKEHGFVVAVVDKASRGAEAKYWIDDFLHVVPRNDGYNLTKKVVGMCKDYVKTLDSSVDKSQKAMMLNRFAEMMKNGLFDMEQVSKAVFNDGKMAEDFFKFKDQYNADGGGIGESIVTDPNALKHLSFGNLTNIRLDNNFGISIRGGENLLEKGYDEERGMKYYKLYFREEK